jgi:hypothetical protein
MKIYRFIDEALLDAITHTMKPDDIVNVLINDLGFRPQAAAQACGALIRHANDAMPMSYHPRQAGDKDDSNSGLDDNDLIRLLKSRSAGQKKAEASIPTYLFLHQEEDVAAHA